MDQQSSIYKVDSFVLGTPLRIINISVDLSTISPKYYKFINVFSKAKVEILVLYHFYNLQIKLENREKPPIRTIHLLSAVDQEILKEFVCKNLNMRFIQPISFSHRALVLFVKKKDRSLYLCINFWELSCITWKDKYPLLLISNLLESSWKACIYTKINL